MRGRKLVPSPHREVKLSHSSGHSRPSQAMLPVKLLAFGSSGGHGGKERGRRVARSAAKAQAAERRPQRGLQPRGSSEGKAAEPFKATSHPFIEGVKGRGLGSGGRDTHAIHEHGVRGAVSEEQESNLQGPKTVAGLLTNSLAKELAHEPP